jgi:hypothetical protein
MMAQTRITNELKSINEAPYDWQGMRIKDILKELELGGITVYWGAWTEKELNDYYYMGNE